MADAIVEEIRCLERRKAEIMTDPVYTDRARDFGGHKRLIQEMIELEQRLSTLRG